MVRKIKFYRVWYSPLQARWFSAKEFKEVERDLKHRPDSDEIPVEAMSKQWGKRIYAFYYKEGKEIRLSKLKAEKWIG